MRSDATGNLKVISMSQRIWFIALVSSSIALAGCGQGQTGPKASTVVAVSGTVTLDGKPMPDGQVSFAVAGDGPVGITIKDGQFSGKVSAGQKRVEICRYRPGKPVKMGDVETPGEPENYLPIKYSTQSALTATIKADGNSDLKFEVTSE